MMDLLEGNDECDEQCKHPRRPHGPVQAVAVKRSPAPLKVRGKLRTFFGLMAAVFVGMMLNQYTVPVKAHVAEFMKPAAQDCWCSQGANVEAIPCACSSRDGARARKSWKPTGYSDMNGPM